MKTISYHFSGIDFPGTGTSFSFRILMIMILQVMIFQNVKAENCTVNAGLDQTICASSTLTLYGTYNGLPVGGTTTWTQVDGPSVIIDSPNSLNTTVTGYTGGNIYKFWLSATCEDGTTVHDECIVTVKSITISDAGPDQTLCPGTPAGNLAGKALGANESGSWSEIGTDNAGVTVVTTGSATSAINLSTTNAGSTTLRWTITNSNGCTSIDNLIVTNLGGAVINAGPDINVATCYTSTVSATMAASNPGIAPQSGLWTVVSGPNMPTITNPASASTTVTNLIQGTYVLRWTVSGPCRNGYDEMQITVPPPTQGLTGIGSNSSVTYCDSRTSVVLNAASPAMPGETVLWTQTSGPTTATITSPNSPNTSVTNLNPASGNSYVFRYTISNTYGCSAYVTRTINFVGAPTAMNVSSVVLTCGANTASIPYTVAGGNRTQFRILSGPSGTTYTFPTSFTTTGSSPVSITGLTSSGIYTVEFKREVNGATNTSCPPITTIITITVSNSASGSTSGTPQILACNVTSTGLAGNIPVSGTGTWSQVSGPNTATLANKNLYNTGISGLIPGQYIFRWLISNGPMCTTTQDDVSVTVSNAVPTSANAGPDQTVCYGTPIQMNGNSPAANETGTWTVVPSSGVVISDIHSRLATITFPNSSTTYTVTWTITNACGSKSDNAIMTTTSTVGPIQSLAGADQCLAAGTTSITLDGNNPAPGTGTWTRISGGSATITDATLNNTTVTGLTNGTYTFEWAITRGAGCVVTRDTTMVTINGAVTTANAGPDQTLCGTSATMAGNVAAIGTGKWTQVSGPGGFTITNSASPTTTITGLTDGVYTFRWTISNGNAACTPSYDDVILYVSTITPSAANAGTDISRCQTTATATLNATAPTVGTGLWSLVSGPNAPTIADPSLRNTAVSSLVQGSYTFRWTVTAGPYCPSSVDDVVVTYSPNVQNFTTVYYCNVSEIPLTGTSGSVGTWVYVSGGSTTPVVTTTGDNTAIATNLAASATAYVFRYSTPSIGGCPSDNGTINVWISSLSVTANAGLDRTKCKANASDTIQLHGNTPGSGNTGTWAKVSGGSGGTVFSPTANSNEAYVTISNIGDYYYSWTITPTGCTTCCSSQDLVRITVDSAYVAYAGPNQDICGTSATLAATPVSNPSYGTWTQDSGPNAATFSSTIMANPAITGLINGTYIFRWTVTNTPCANSSSTVTINVSTPPTAPDAGIDQTICNASTVTMAANTITTGTGSWTQVGGPTATIVSPSSPSSDINLTGGTGTYTFQWNSINGSCSLSDQVTVYNQPQTTVANAGPNTSYCQYQSVYLAGNTPETGTGAWSFISGPTTPTIMTPSSPTSQVIGLEVGTYTFRWTITNPPCAESTSDVVITITHLPTTANAGSNQTIGCNVSTGTLAGNLPSYGTGTWTQVSGPSTAVFANSHLYNTGISGLVPGIYHFKWTIVNGNCSSEDEMQFEIDPAYTDLSIAKTDGSISYGAGTSNIYTVTVTNAGPDNAVGAIVTDNAPSGTTITGWTATYTGGASGPASGTGNISATVAIPVGGSAIFSVTIAIPCDFSGSLINTASVAARTCDIDPDPNNNSASDTDNPNVWNGSVSDNWNDAANWSLGVVPSCFPAVNAIIPGGLSRYPVIYNTGMCAANLDIQNTANLTVNAGKDVTVTGCTNINGPCGLQLKSDSANGNASFVTTQTGSVNYPNSGTACVDLFLRQCVGYNGCWHYIASPITNAAVGVFEGDYIKSFDETTGEWSDYYTHLGTPMNVLQGYIVHNETSGIRTFRGQLNDGTLQQTLSRHLASARPGWNLVGNPYPSEIDLNTDLNWTNVDRVVYYYDMVAGNYLAYLANPYGFGLGTRYVPSMQGFFVHVYDGGAPNYSNTSGTIQFTDNNRTTIGDVTFYKDLPENVLKLKVEGSSGKNDQALVYFSTDLTTGFDQDKDAQKLPGNVDSPQLFTVGTDDIHLSIDGRPYEGVNTVVPLSFYQNENGTGNYILTAGNLDSFRFGATVTLEDIKAGRNQDLTSLPTYEFSYTAGDDPSRFLLHFHNPFFGIEDKDVVQDLQIYSYGKDIYVKDLTGNPRKGDFYLYNEMGQEITSKPVSAVQINKYTLNVTKGYYMVRVITRDNSYNAKVFIE